MAADIDEDAETNPNAGGQTITQTLRRWDEVLEGAQASAASRRKQKPPAKGSAAEKAAELAASKERIKRLVDVRETKTSVAELAKMAAGKTAPPSTVPLCFEDEVRRKIWPRFFGKDRQSRKCHGTRRRREKKLPLVKKPVPENLAYKFAQLRKQLSSAQLLQAGKAKAQEKTLKVKKFLLNRARCLKIRLWNDARLTKVGDAAEEKMKRYNTFVKRLRVNKRILDLALMDYEEAVLPLPRPVRQVGDAVAPPSPHPMGKKVS